MKYDAVTEIISILKIEDEINTNEEILNNLKYLTLILNFELGNIRKRNYDSYEKEITINNKSLIITIKKLSGKKEIEVVHQQRNNFINLKFDNNEVYLNKLSILYPHGMYILDEKEKTINYYDKKTIEYVRKVQQKTKDSCYIELKDLEENGLIPDEIIYLSDNNIDQLNLYKKIIINTKNENEELLENMKNNKNKVKTLTKTNN